MSVKELEQSSCSAAWIVPTGTLMQVSQVVRCRKLAWLNLVLKWNNNSTAGSTICVRLRDTNIMLFSPRNVWELAKNQTGTKLVLIYTCCKFRRRKKKRHTHPRHQINSCHTESFEIITSKKSQLEQPDTKSYRMHSGRNQRTAAKPLWEEAEISDCLTFCFVENPPNARNN